MARGSVQAFCARRSGWLRAAGLLLTGGPVVLMLVTGVWASCASGRLLMDVLLPAELGALTLPGMMLLAAAAMGQKPGRALVRASVLLPVGAAASLVLCQVTALAFGSSDGGLLGAVLRAVPFLMLAVYDLAVIAALVTAVLCLRRKTPRDPDKRE